MSLLIALLTPALAGWTEAGPERGHVVDAAVGPEAVSVATRVGVVSAPLSLERWARDPRFPPETKVLSYGPDGVAWAAPPGALWRVGERSEAVVQLGASAAVDLAVTGDGALLAAVRGASPQVLRVGDGPTPVLQDVDPWRVLAEGQRAWVATLDKGAWASDDGGRSFEQVLEGRVSALGLVGGRALAGTAEGALVDLGSGETLLQLDGGWISAIADAQGEPLLVIESMGGRTPPLARLHEGALQDVPLFNIDEDDGFVRPTGAWSLPGGAALIGTFRRGPLKLEGERLSVERSGLRATVTGGVAGSPEGQVLLAAMGTGAYLSGDAATWAPQHGQQGPVTDAVGVAWTGEGFAVTDFEGVAVQGAQRWSRLSGVEVPGVPRRSGLSMASKDAQGRWWALDDKGGLYLREGERWTPCKEKGERLEGFGEDLVLASGRGFLGLSDCAATATLRWSGLTVSASGARSDGGWVAGGGGLWKDGAQLGALPPGRVQALAGRDEAALVAMDSGALLRCDREGCAPAGALPGIAIAGLGWLADGRVWVAEEKGTVLVGEGEGGVSPWSTVTPVATQPFESHRLYTPPWGSEGKAGGPPPGPGGPQGGPGDRPMGPGDRPMGPGTPPEAAQESATPPSEPEGCGCASAPRPTGAWLLAMLGLLSLRRRR
ncbi:MAG: hypothetical protein H6741_11800 [Alphaproteobacteria bacterium]|nr:hypothetical protein [Alphaproteobacteria bacterium]MCB9793395.1 hypothetical protein [Alphaproteobacteria bacterium]